MERPRPQPDQPQPRRDAGGSSRGLPIKQREQPEPEQNDPFSSKRYLEEMRTVYEKDANLFVSRVMEGFEALLGDRIPQAQHEEESRVEESSSYFSASGYKRDKPIPDLRLLRVVSDKGKAEGYTNGLRDAFLDIYERVTGNRIRIPIT